MASSPDWRNAGDYAWLETAGRQWFAWEWLRRSEAYRRDWQEPCAPARFGLVRCEDPQRCALDVLPIWSAAASSFVLVASAVAPDAWDGDAEGLSVDFAGLGLEVRRLDRGVLTHLLIGERAAPIRVDLLGAGEVAGSVVLVWHLAGLQGLLPRLRSLRRLVALVGGEPVAARPVSLTRLDRHILMLRCADALTEGASHQAIARGLFGNMVAPDRWRIEAPSVRVRVQRLVQATRVMLDRDPRCWLDGVEAHRFAE